MDVEQQVRREFAVRTAAAPNPVDLAGRAIARAGGVRRRRRLVVVSAAAAIVVMVLAVALIPTPGPNLVAIPPPKEGVLTELAALPVGAPPRVAVYGRHTLRLPTGADVRLNTTGPDPVSRVRRAGGGWLQNTPHRDGTSSLRVIRDNGAALWSVEGVLSWAVSRDGSRVAVQTRQTQATPSITKVDVYDFAAGQWKGSTTVPRLGSSSDDGPRVAGWAGALVVLTDATTEGVSTVDVWNPTGAYQPSPVPLHLIGATGAQVLGIERGVVGAPGCLVRMDPAAGFAETARSCDTGYRNGRAFPWLSPDGNQLVSWQAKPARELFVLDVSTMAPVPPRTMLPLPEGVSPMGVWWEDASTVLLRVLPDDRNPGERMDLVRCRVNGSGCELAPTPKVDGADPIGIAQ